MAPSISSSNARSAAAAVATDRASPAKTITTSIMAASTGPGRNPIMAVASFGSRRQHDSA